MHLSIAAQRFETEKARHYDVAWLNTRRFLMVEQLSSYHPLRGHGDAEARLASCRHKTRFTDRADAERALSKMRKRDQEWPQRVYGCSICGGFHFTTDTRKARRAG